MTTQAIDATPTLAATLDHPDADMAEQDEVAEHCRGETVDAVATADADAVVEAVVVESVADEQPAAAPADTPTLPSLPTAQEEEPAPADAATAPAADDAAVVALLQEAVAQEGAPLEPAFRQRLVDGLAAFADRLRDEPSCEPAPAPAWSVDGPADGKATIRLGERYELQLDEGSSEMRIVDKQTNETTRIWGDPHVDWNNDGQNDVDFKHTTTFTLEDGTKLTIGTQRWGQTEAWISDTVTITNGDNAIVVEGLGQQTKGDLTITQSQKGGSIDEATADGYVVKENADGIGWLDASDGTLADQADFNRADASFGAPVGAGDEPAEDDHGLVRETLRVVTDLVGAKQDGRIDTAERRQLVKDLLALMQRLLEGGTVARTEPPAGETPPAPGPADARARPDNKMHDAVWYFQQTGLADFLSGYLGENDDGLTRLVENTLRNRTAA